jgi:hypothetical protein
VPKQKFFLSGSLILAQEDKSAQAAPIAPNENTQKTNHLLTIIKPLKKNKKNDSIFPIWGRY